jgi:SAM-dependent methyltransferase
VIDGQASLTAVDAYWGALYRSAYADLDAHLDRETLEELLDETEAMFRLRQHLATTEMPIGALAGKRVLEIGCGAGSHSALFARHGAQMSSIDLSFDRAQATARKFRLLESAGYGSAALQGNAERLPFSDSTFDIVYSNGVLHHSPDTVATIQEVRRVLKPGGLAVVMLYCRSSINWWITLWLGYGIFRGQLRHGQERLGTQTEWAGTHKINPNNPVTRAYGKSEVDALFAGFENLHLRKSEFSLAHLPKLGKIWQRRLARHGRLHRGGLLPYGSPWPMTSPVEMWIGRYLGWAWNIQATKPRQSGL